MKGRVIKKKVTLIIIVTLVFSVSLFLTFNEPPLNQNPLTLPTQQISPTNMANPKMGNHLQYLMQISNPSEEYEMIIFFEKTVNYTQGISLLENLGDFEIISNYTLLGGVCIKAPIRMAETISQQNYIRTVTYNVEIKISDQITINEVQTKDTIINELIGAKTLQETYNLNGTGVIVAVIDTGINSHIDLDGSRIIYNESFVPDEISQDLNGHGTAVAGVIGASGTSATGVAPEVEFLNLKALNKYGEGKLDWVLQAINAALNTTAHSKPDIISMSLGGEGSSHDDMCMAVNSAWINNDTIVVVAAGNSGGSLYETYYKPYYQTINSPGLAANIITVGATGGLYYDYIDYQSIAYFSSRGPTDDGRAKPDIVAPGINLKSLLYNNPTYYVIFSGTSAAAPVVSGAIALLLSDNSNVSWISPNTVKAAIMMNADDLGENPFAQGAGQINITRAYNYLQYYYLTETNSTPPLVITPIRALARPMLFWDLLPTSVVLTVIVGNVSRTPIINAFFNVSGNAVAFTSVYSGVFSNLSDTQEFVPVSFIVHLGRSVYEFSGNLALVNGSGEQLYVIPLALNDASFINWPVSLSLLFTILNMMISANNTRNIIYVVLGVVALASVAIVGIVLVTLRVRKLKALRIVEAQNDLLQLSTIPLNYCPYCGTRVQGFDFFCYNCGKQIRVPPPQPYFPK